MYVDDEVSFPFRIFSQQESKNPHNTPSRCCSCSLFETVRVCRQTFSEIQKYHSLFYRFWFSFLSFIIDVLDSEISHVLKDELLVTVAQQLEEIFSIHMYEISFIVYIVVFGVKGYSMWNN